MTATPCERCAAEVAYLADDELLAGDVGDYLRELERLETLVGELRVAARVALRLGGADADLEAELQHVSARSLQPSRLRDDRPESITCLDYGATLVEELRGLVARLLARNPSHPSVGQCRAVLQQTARNPALIQKVP